MSSSEYGFESIDEMTIRELDRLEGIAPGGVKDPTQSPSTVSSAQSTPVQNRKGKRRREAIATSSPSTSSSRPRIKRRTSGPSRLAHTLLDTEAAHSGTDTSKGSLPSEELDEYESSFVVADDIVEYEEEDDVVNEESVDISDEDGVGVKDDGGVVQPGSRVYVLADRAVVFET
ncbi:unnamed protein product [Peniophora sp. CBMAI 1063]|nr:unnamed protein product [Peniophora sp. CBMAI 1063]